MTNTKSGQDHMRF